jgi:hypothetical protein
MIGPTMIERRRLADERMANAKRRFTEAARKALSGDPDAPKLAQEAFREVSDAQAELQALYAEGPR